MAETNEREQLKSYQYHVELNKISYGISEFESFEVREVFIDEKPKGEYHIKIKDGSSLENAVMFFKREFGGDCEVGLVDPSGTLALEYPIYIKVTNQLLIDGMNEAFVEINKTLLNYKKNQ